MGEIRFIAAIMSLFMSFCTFSQNAPPLISNVTAVADTVFHKLTVRFDLSDAENEYAETFLAASADGGGSFALNTANASGDVGFPVATGFAKQIVWYYPDSLSQMVNDFVVKVVADDRHIPGIQQIIAQIDTGRLRQNLQFIEGIRHRTTGAAHLQEVRDSLSGIFQRYGLQTRIHGFPFDASFNGQNIIGRKPGIVSDTKTYIVDGHYDTVNDSPGADDNGSAIAGMLEILHVISTLQLKNSVEFIAFDLEESGLAGSVAFVPDGIIAYEDIQGVINMDMIGYFSNVPNSQTVPAGFEIAFPDLYAELVANNFRGNFIISTANTNSKPLQIVFDTMASQYVPSLLVGSIEVAGNGEFIPDSRRSDHVAFWDAGYTALHLSDGAETRNPNYHDPTDTLGSVNFSFMSDVTKAVFATILNLVQPLHSGEAVAQVSADPASGVLELDGHCKWTLAPNPTDGRLKIFSENCGDVEITFRMISLDGKVIFQKNISPGKKSEIDFRKDAEPGYYLLELGNLRNSFSRKIFVK